MALSLRRVCRCSHAPAAHEHYRRGSDCSSCECSRYRRGFVLTLSVGTTTPAPSVILPERVEEAVGPYVRPTHSAGTGGRERVLPLVVSPRGKSAAPVVRKDAKTPV